MALLTDFYLESSVNAECNIIVNDITTYPYGIFIQRPRPEVALFLFYDKTAFSGSIDGANGSNPNQYDIQSSWTIVPTGNGTYSVRVFLAPIWVSAVYAMKSIVFYNGLFWHAYSLMAPTSVPGIHPDWLEISYSTQAEIDTAFSAFQAADTINLIGYVDVTVVVECPNFDIQKDSCYHYTITDNTNTMYIKTINIHNYGTNVLLMTTTINPAVGTTASIDLTAYGDGVYTAIISWYVGTTQYTEIYIIYEYCSIWNCYQSIFQALACGQYNPCCTTCDADTLLQMQTYREALNIITGFLFSIWAYINVERVTYTGIFSIDETRDEYISRVNDYIIKAKELIITCGWCNASETDSIDDPCINC